jgi:D-alanine-D-alanine ligase
LLAGAGLPTAPFHYIRPDDPLPEQELAAALADGPWIVKPAREDASLGIDHDSVATDMDALRRRVDLIRGRYGDVLVERFIAGREFNVGIVALPVARALPLAEIIFGAQQSPWRIVTYEAKWSPNSQEDLATPARCPAEVELSLGSEIQRIALAAFRYTNCQDYARVDLRVDDQGRTFILEVNGNPDISPSAGFARALRVAGFDYDDFICRLTEQAAARR